MEGLCPCGHEPTGSIVPVSELVTYMILLLRVRTANKSELE